MRRWPAALPQPDLSLDKPAPAVKYLHRRWRDADFYFVFNESDARQQSDAAPEKSGVRLPLDPAPYESKFNVVGGA
jgi:hypothetical protein